MRPARFAAVVAAAVSALSLVPSCACGPGGPADAGGLTVTLGTPDVSDEGFTVVTDGAVLELYMGQQGAFFTRFRYAVAGTDDRRVDVSARVDIEGVGFAVNALTRSLEPDKALGLVSETHMMLFNSLLDGTKFSLADLHGRNATVEASVTDSAGRTGTVTLAIVLRDDDPCIDCGGGVCLPPDDPDSCALGGMDGLDAGIGRDAAAADAGADSGL